MARLNFGRYAVLGALALSASVACFAACSSDNGNPAPGEDGGSGAKPSTGGKKGTGGSTGSTGGKSGMKDGGMGGSSSGGETGDGSTSTGGSTGPATDSGSGGTTSGGDAGTPPPEPKCKPNATGFFSKTCTDSKCTPFDNTQLQNLNNGQLPPLQ